MLQRFGYRVVTVLVTALAFGSIQQIPGLINLSDSAQAAPAAITGAACSNPNTPASPTGQTATAACDSNTTTVFLSVAENAALKIDLNSAYVITSFQIIAGADDSTYPQRRVQSLTLKGCTDNTYATCTTISTPSWTSAQLDPNPNSSAYPTPTDPTSLATNVNGYRYYLVNTTSYGSAASAVTPPSGVTSHPSWDAASHGCTVGGTAYRCVQFAEFNLIGQVNAALTPIFNATKTPTADGFTVQLDNYNNAYTWAATATTGTATISGSGLVTVTGVAPGTASSVTVTTTRTGYTGGTATSASVTSITGAALNPTFDAPTSTTTGFTLNINNYSSSYTWATPTLSAGSFGSTGSIAITSTSGTNRLLTISGLAPGESATVTQATSRSGYANGTGTATGTANSGAALNPTFGTPSATANGFTVQINNYNVAYGWTGTATAGGSVSINGTGLVTVTGVAANTTSTATITTTRRGYSNGSNTVSTASLNAALDPTFSSVTSLSGGFSVDITNFDSSYTWASPTTTAGVVTAAAAAGSTQTLTVTGLFDGASATITQTNSKAGSVGGLSTITGTALPAGKKPTFGPVTKTATGFTVNITNYDPTFTWNAPTISNGTIVVATASGSTQLLTVTGLAAGQSATITQTTSKAGVANGSTSITGSAVASTAYTADCYGIPASMLKATSTSTNPLDTTFLVVAKPGDTIKFATNASNLVQCNTIFIDPLSDIGNGFFSNIKFGATTQAVAVNPTSSSPVVASPTPALDNRNPFNISFTISPTTAPGDYSGVLQIYSPDAALKNWGTSFKFRIVSSDPVPLGSNNATPVNSDISCSLFYTGSAKPLFVPIENENVFGYVYAPSINCDGGTGPVTTFSSTSARMGVGGNYYFTGTESFWVNRYYRFGQGRTVYGILNSLANTAAPTSITPYGVTLNGSMTDRGVVFNGTNTTTTIRYCLSTSNVVNVIGALECNVGRYNGFFANTLQTGGQQVAISMTQSTASPTPITGLSSDTSYFYQIYGTNVAGITTYGSVVSFKTSKPAPNAPSPVVAVGNGTSAIVSFELAPNGSDPITGYTVTAYNSAGTALPITTTGSASPVTISGLTIGQTYKFKVVAKTAVSQSVDSNFSNTITSVAPHVPSATSVPTVMVIAPNLPTKATTEFIISFNAPNPDLGSSPITSYTAQAYVGGVQTAFQVSGTSSPLVISIPSGSIVYGNYTFNVWATNLAGDGPATPSVSQTVSPSTLYSPPTNPVITSVVNTRGSTSVTVNYNAPTSTAGLTVNSYTATATINGVATAFASTGTGLSLTITGLTYGVTYQVDVRANTDAGTSSQNLSDSFMPMPLPVPSTPAQLSITTGSAKGRVNLTWNPPVTTNGTILNYKFTAYGATGAPISFTVASPAQPYVFQFTDTQLANGPFVFTVAAENATGFSGESTPSRVYNVPTVPTTPVLTSTNINPVVVLGQTITFESNTVTLDDFPLTKYVLTFHARTVARTVASPTDVSIDITSPSCDVHDVCTYTITSSNLSALQKTTASYGGDIYPYEYLTLTAVNLLGSSASSNSVSLVPGKGGAIDSYPGNGELIVTPTNDPNAAAATSITVYAYSSAQTLSATAAPLDAAPAGAESCSILLPLSTCVISGLTNGTRYYIYSRNFNSTGGGYWGNTTGGANNGGTSYVTPVDVSTKSPENVFASGNSSSATVTWDLPNMGATDPTVIEHAITGYVVTATSSDGGATVVDTTTATSVSGVVDRKIDFLTTGAKALTSGKTYTFTVKAIVQTTYSSISAGYSGSSIPSNSVLLADVPGVPTLGSVTLNGATASIPFTAPGSNGGSAITGYAFIATPTQSGLTLSAAYTSTSSPFTFTGLNSTTTYTFKVAATNIIGTGAYSAPSSLPTKLTLDVLPDSVTVDAGTLSVSFTKKFKVAGSIVDPTMSNSGWVEPVCAISPTYSSGTSAGNYPITCSGGNAGALYNFNFATDTLTVVATVPSAPTSVSATLANQSAIVAFNPPTIVGSGPITGYTVTTFINGFATSQTTTGTASPITVTGLIPGLSFSFAVTATNGTGTSVSSSTSAAAIMPKSILYVVPRANQITQGTASVTFPPDYLLNATDTSTAVNPMAGNTGWITPSCDISPAYSASTAMGSHQISCSGGNGGALYTLNFGLSSTLIVTQSTANTSAPQSVTASTSGSGSVIVNFAAPAIANPAATTYTITAIPVGGGTPVSITVTAPATTATLSSLSANTQYQINVSANNPNGPSLPGVAYLTTGAAPSSGGGSSGGSVAPVTPITPVTPVTPVVPVTPGVNPITQTPGSTAPTGNSVSVDGTSERVVITRKVEINAVSVTGNNWNLLINTLDSKGNRVPVAAGPVLEATTNNQVEISGEGFAPNSIVAIYVFSKPTLLGTINATATGSFYGVQNLPLNLSLGEHFIQVVGYTLDNKVRTATLQLLVKAAPVATKTIKQTASMSIYFANNSYKVDSKSTSKIKQFVATIKQNKGPFEIKVVGMVEPTKYNGIPVKKLSQYRANALATQLQKAGLKGLYSIIAGGLSKGRGWLNRYATVTVTWSKQI